LEAIRASGLPTVLIGRPSLDVDLPYVAVDNVQAARAATAHLADQGRRRVVHLAGPASQTTMADRAAGYAAELAARGLPSEIIATDGTAEDGLRALAALLDRTGPSPDAVFAATDRLAVAALGLAADRGLTVPRDLAVVGFDDLPLAAYLRPSLSTVAQPAQELGETAIALALALADGEHPQPVTLRAQLIVRASSGPANA
jgi:DNA-binding LacI/PurR family transcriptional regulator